MAQDALEQIVIPLSRPKQLRGLAFVALMTAGLCALLTLDLPEENVIIFRTIIILGILLMVAVGIFSSLKLFDKKAGLIIDENGITDNTNNLSIGLIEWKDIVVVGNYQIMNTSQVLLFTNVPDKYINKAKSSKQRLMRMNQKTTGTPLILNATMLQCTYKEMESTVHRYFERYGNSNKNS